MEAAELRGRVEFSARRLVLLEECFDELNEEMAAYAAEGMRDMTLLGEMTLASVLDAQERETRYGYGLVEVLQAKDRKS